MLTAIRIFQSIRSVQVFVLFFAESHCEPRHHWTWNAAYGLFFMLTILPHVWLFLGAGNRHLSPLAFGGYIWRDWMAKQGTAVSNLISLTAGVGKGVWSQRQWVLVTPRQNRRQCNCWEGFLGYTCFPSKHPACRGSYHHHTDAACAIPSIVCQMSCACA